jgi:hypothetical protein
VLTGHDAMSPAVDRVSVDRTHHYSFPEVQGGFPYEPSGMKSNANASEGA